MVNMTMANLSEEELSTLEKFREKMQDLLKPHHDDRFLLRWLRARRFNLQNAEKMLREDFKFRELHQVDTIRETFKLKKGLEEYNPTHILGFTEEGMLVRFFNLGICDMKGEMDIYRGEQNNLKKGLQAEKCVLLFDLKDMKTETFYDRAVPKSLIAMAKTVENHYPERLHSIFVLNVPNLFYYGVSVFGPFLDPVVRSKIKIFGKDGWHEELFSLVPKEIVPAFIGGERYGPGHDPYCNDFLNWKYPLPKSLYAIASGLKKSDPRVKERIVRPFSSFELELQVSEPGSTIQWDFQTTKYEIRFGLKFNEQECESTNKGKKQIFPFESFECHLFPEKGKYICERTGKYFLLFDNSHSWFTSKKLLYKIEVLPPNSEEELMKEN